MIFRFRETSQNFSSFRHLLFPIEKTVVWMLSERAEILWGWLFKTWVAFTVLDSILDSILCTNIQWEIASIQSKCHVNKVSGKWKQISKSVGMHSKTHSLYTNLIDKETSHFQFSHPGVPGIHRNPKQKEFFESTEGFVRAGLNRA